MRPNYFKTTVFSKFSFTNCCGYGFIKYLNRQHISKKTSLHYNIDTTSSPTEFPSVMLGLRVLVQPAKPDLSVRLLCNQLPNVYAFSAHKILIIFCAPFPNRISHFKILVVP